MKRAVATESQEQRAVVEWWATYCKLVFLPEFLLFSVPNAQKFMSLARNPHAALAAVRKEGHRDGVPDLFLAVPKNEKFQIHQAGHTPVGFTQPLFAGLFLEMKRKGEKPNETQAAFHLELRKRGYNVIVAQGFEEARRAITEYLGKL